MIKYFQIISVFIFNFNWPQPIANAQLPIVLPIANAQSPIVSAQSPASILNELVLKFNKIKNYTADVQMVFDIPFVRIEELYGKVYFKQPDKFRVKTEGIAFLPKQNPYDALAVIKDSSDYTAVESGNEIYGKVKARVINVLPRNHPELILAKFWIDPVQKLILKSQLTTKSNGTIQVDYQYGSMAKFTLPDKMTFTVETGKFKVPKAMAIELNSKKKENTSEKPRETGIIQLSFSNYLLNQKIDDNVFKEN